MTPSLPRPRLRLAWHRGTTAHACSVYPFSVQAPLTEQGVFVGVDLLAGGAAFCWDPFDAYRSGIVTNPNAWLVGEPGTGKSALVKCLLWRMAAVHGADRWVAIVDPKGEYTPIADKLGLTVIRLAPGGTTRLNPLAGGPGATGVDGNDSLVLRQAEMVGALTATVLNRPLTQIEEAALFAAVEHLAHTPAAGLEPTLVDVATLLADPTETMYARLRHDADRVAEHLAPVRYALDKLLTRTLQGMFDGPSTVPPPWDGPGLVLDLSAIPLTSEALPLVMVAAAGWLQHLMAQPGPQRVQVLDEAWALLTHRHTATYLQSCWKLGRTYGVANIGITHRVTDLAAQADDGTTTAKIAAGLLADSATKIIHRQAPDQHDQATTAFGLTHPEADVIAHLTRGRALWKLADHTALVHHGVAPCLETTLCDTDTRMQGRPPTTGRRRESGYPSPSMATADPPRGSLSGHSNA